MSDGLTTAIEEAAREATRKAAEAMNEEEAVDWLKALDKDLWKPESRYNPHTFNTRRWRQPSRDMTLEELDTFLVLAPRFVLVPYGMGFGIGMKIYAHPMMPGTDPTNIAKITSDLLPEKAVTAVLNPMHTVRERQGFLAGWEIFSPLTHREQNAKWLKMYGFPELEDKRHYDY